MQASSPSARDRVSKRSSNACARCRRQKIKCSGTHPCGNCLKRQLLCEFDYRDQRIVVSRGYIMDLQKAIEEAEQRGAAPENASEPATGGPAAMPVDRNPGPSHQRQVGRATSDSASLITEIHDQVAQAQAREPSPQLAYPTPSLVGPEGQGTPRPGQREDNDRESSSIDNPLALRHPEFTTTAEGTAHYLGTSSNWSFTRRVLVQMHEHVHHTPLPAQSLLFDGAVYDIDWSSDGQAASENTKAVLPTFDYALYLISTVKFNCGQLFHLFDEDEFMASLHKFYADGSGGTLRTSPWFIQFNFVMALGQALQSRKRREKLPYGYELFCSTMQNLPRMGVLMKTPIIAVEILCCAALYLHCIDHRHYAHVFLGDALRIALFQGLHINMPTAQLGDHYVERCRRAWWTLYVLDHEMTLLMGLPMAVRESDLTCPLPAFSGSKERVATMEMQVRLYRILANASDSIYGNSGSVNRDYTTRAREALEDIAELSDELRGSFPLHQKENIGGVSRIASHLHLLYHRCIIIVTRPLLLALLKHRLSSLDTYLALLSSMRTARNLIHMCIDSSQKTITILDWLLSQGLISPFLHYDLEAAFVASTPLILGPVIDPQLPNGNQAWMRKAYAIFDDMINSGNQVAGFRKAELQRLDELARLVTANGDCREIVGPIHLREGTPVLDSTTSGSRMADVESTSQMSFDEDMLLGDNFLDGLTKEHILGVADAIADEDMAWMYDSIVMHDAS